MIIACPTCRLQYDVRSYPEGTVVQCRCGQHMQVPAHKIAAVRCPSCGGTVDAEAQRCQFCQTMLSRKTCPKCFAAVREEAKFCDQCGETIRAIGGTTAMATEHDCPRCKAPLFSQTCSGYPVEACAECLGFWIAHETLDHIYRDAPKQVAPVQETGLPVSNLAESSARQGAQGAGYIPCPICGNIMNRLNYARRSGVLIDICRQHGTWFDADELNKILEFHAKGGVERSRQRDLENAKIELQQQKFTQQVAAGMRGMGTTEPGNTLFQNAIISIR